MKFGKRLLGEIEPQWAEFYVAYKALKKIIHAMSPDRVKEFDETYQKSMKDVNEHAKQIAEDFHRMYHELKTALASEVTGNGEDNGSFNFPGSPRESAQTPREALLSKGGGTHVPIPRPKTIVMEEKWFDKILRFTVVHDKLRPFRSTRRAFKRVYRMGMKVMQYITLNQEGFRKILKKYAKEHPSEGGQYQFDALPHLAVAPFCLARAEIESTLNVIEIEYKSYFDDDITRFIDISSAQQRWHIKWKFIGVGAIIFTILLAIPILESNVYAHRCLALMAFIVTLWITEAMPYFCTAMLIPVVAVIIGAIPDPVKGGTMSADASSNLLLNAMFNHVQILVLGGLSISKAFGKHGLEKVMARFIHDYTAHRPNLYFLMIMLLGALLSGFVSNVASPVLMLGVLQQTLWALPPGSGAPQAILLGLAFSCNLGGMMTPIASPQNAVAQNVMEGNEVSFIEWLLLSFPVVFLGILACWGALLYIWKPFKNISYIPKPEDHEVTAINWRTPSEVHLVLVVFFATVTLWVLQPVTGAVFGDPAIVALFPIIIFFGVGVLRKEDFNQLSWHLIFLLAGGNMLGLCAQKSSLLSIIAESMRPFFESHSSFEDLIMLVLFVGIITSFISHTVGALILLPIVKEIATMKGLGSRELIFCAVVMCSGAMAFPITSFPNVNSLLAEDDQGKPYLLARHYLVPGMVGTLVCFGVTVGVVYPLAREIF
eukprot:PhF_6_TR29293/c0_g1_i1/m.42935/K14430/PHO87_91; phosphate transporter